MISFDEMGELLDKLAEELPPEFFHELNGGIILLPQVELHPEGRANDLYVLGRYFKSPDMGRYIAIYYGSFERLFSHLSGQALTAELRKTLRHEFRHHMESLSGEHGLEIEDEEFMRRYRESGRRD